MQRLLVAHLLIVAILLVGCTASFTYNRLNWLIPWYVDGYVDLTREQREVLEGKLDPLLQWHRREELVRYVAILDRIEHELATPPTAGTVQGWIDEIVSAVERTESHMLALALDFGATISDEQMASFANELWKRQREYEAEFLERSDEQYSRDAFHNLRGLLRRFVGRLDGQQEQRLRMAAGELHRFDQPWLEERALWLQTLEPLLQRGPGWQPAVRAAYAVRKTNRTPRYREYLAHNTDVICRGVADVLGQLSDKQRNRLAREIDDLRARLRELSADSPMAAAHPAAIASRST